MKLDYSLAWKTLCLFTDEARLFSLKGQEVAGTNWNTGNGIWTLEKAGSFYHDSGRTLVQTGSGDSIFGEIWNQTGHACPKQPVLLDPTLSRGGWIENSLRFLLTSAVLRFCKAGCVRFWGHSLSSEYRWYRDVHGLFSTIVLYIHTSVSITLTPLPQPWLIIYISVVGISVERESYIISPQDYKEQTGCTIINHYIESGNQCGMLG